MLTDYLSMIASYQYNASDRQLHANIDYAFKNWAVRKEKHAFWCILSFGQ